MFRFIVVLTKSHENLNDNEQFTVKDVTIKTTQKHILLPCPYTYFWSIGWIIPYVYCLCTKFYAKSVHLFYNYKKM